MSNTSILSLPVEIVVKIFLEGTELWRNFDPQTLPLPTAVSGVCHHWREISEDMPELWTYILPPLHKELDDCLEWTSKWLERSKSLLVSVVLDDMKVTNDFKRPQVTAAKRKIAKILNLLLEHAHRVLRLDVRSASHGAFKEFMCDLWNAPNLQQLSLCARFHVGHGYMFLPHDDRLEWSALPRLTNLRKFRFQNISPPSIATLTSLTAHNLKLDYQGMRTLFIGSPHLAHLVLHNLPPSAPRQHPADYPAITLHSLQSIAVDVMTWRLDEPDLFYPFSFLCLPNLSYLEIGGDMPAINRLFGSSLSLAAVRKLRLSNMNRLLDDVQYFQQLSSLEELELFGVPASKIFSPSQNQSNGQNKHAKAFSPTWPHLRSVTLDTTNLETLLATLEFVKERLGRPPLKLQTLSLSRNAMRLLREGDETSDAHSRFKSKFGEPRGEEWLESLVEVTTLKGPSYGLLDGSRVPLAAMP